MRRLLQPFYIRRTNIFLCSGVGLFLRYRIEEEILPLELGKFLRLISTEANTPNRLLMHKPMLLIYFNCTWLLKSVDKVCIYAYMHVL